MQGALLALLLALAVYASTDNENIVTNPKNTPSFAVDYEKGTFLLDGEPFRYISGSVHYFRVHPSQWRDRLERVRALGFNAIQYYVPWNFHEVHKGEYDFTGIRDFAAFSKIAADLGLFTLLRAGPYACAEWENGGLPWWLIRDNKDIKQRTNDTRFTAEVTRWFTALAPIVRPLLRQNGGPVLMVQIENEYGSYEACDHDYNLFLRDEAWRLFGKDTVLYTTDPMTSLPCGAVPGVLATVDFGVKKHEEIDEIFAAQRKHMGGAKGPLVNSEFYPGWFAMWGQKEQTMVPDSPTIIKTVDYAYSLGASINFYMIFGGTNFGFWNGAEVDAPVITSYDYSSPISENGEYAESYYAIRDWVADLPGWKQQPTVPPEPLQKIAYPATSLTWKSPTTCPSLRKDCKSTKNPISFEDLDHPFGFVLYSHTIKRCGKNLNIKALNDFGYVTVGSKLQAGRFIKKYNEKSIASIELENCQEGDTLEILVENQGRQTFETINDFKGILSPVILDDHALEDWTQCAIDVPYEAGEIKIDRSEVYTAPAPGATGLYEGTFQVDTLADTFLAMDNWGKGFAVVNGQNVGRYWSSEGPQYTLYVPKAFLKQGENKLQIYEVEGVRNCSSGTCPLVFADAISIRFDNIEAFTGSKTETSQTGNK